MPVRVIVIDGTVADCSKAGELIERIDADYLLADRGYDTDAFVEQVTAAGIKVVIPAKKNRKNQRKYEDERLARNSDKVRVHIIELQSKFAVCYMWLNIL